MIETMIGKRPNMFFVLCWKFISPAVTLVSFFFFVIYSIAILAGQAVVRESQERGRDRGLASPGCSIDLTFLSHPTDRSRIYVSRSDDVL